MKLNNIGSFGKIEDFINWKIEKFGNEEKTFENLFLYMHSEENNIMAEYTENYRIKKLTYGDFKSSVIKKANSLKKMLCLPNGSIVGIYMDNSVDWLRILWSVLMCGYRPLLLNLRISKEVLERVLKQHDVKAVISSKEIFSVNTVISSDIEEDDDAVTFGKWGYEIIFMSSGTTENIKLCAYTAENFYYQLANSVDIVKKCKMIIKHHNGELKLLTLLPFYHVFGFIAVYLWFGFFSRTFVFLKDLNPKTIQSTIKKHEVTHLFAVPLVWESACKAAIREIKSRGEKVWNDFCKAIKLSNSSEFARMILNKSFAEVRDGLFGESIKFLISGGGEISADALEFFNGIGYTLVNGYGMTEVGITSVEISAKPAERNLGSIGAPFVCTEYSISEEGTLLIRGKNMASRIFHSGEDHITDYGKWFDSKDLAFEKGGRYYLQGRVDDLIVSKSGENLNPYIIENEFNIPTAEKVCLVNLNAEPTLIVKSSSCYTQDSIEALINAALAEISRIQLQGEIRKVLVTPDDILGPGEFKFNRRKIVKRLTEGQLMTIDSSNAKKSAVALSDKLEKRIQKEIADILNKDISEVEVHSNFFTDLGGSSLDYFVLSDAIYSTYDVNIRCVDGTSLATISEICEHIKNSKSFTKKEKELCHH